MTILFSFTKTLLQDIYQTLLFEKAHVKPVIPSVRRNLFYDGEISLRRLTDRNDDSF